MLCVRKQADNMLSVCRQYASDLGEASHAEAAARMSVAAEGSKFRLDFRATTRRFEMALQLLGHCGMIWRSLESTLLHRVRKGFGSTAIENRNAAEKRAFKIGDFRDAVLLYAPCLLEELPSLFSSLRFLNLSPEAGV
jgi:hypothetical protein